MAHSHLQLYDSTQGELAEYDLKGFGEDPKPSDHHVLVAQPQQPKSFEILIEENLLEKNHRYKIETDLRGVKGPEKLTVDDHDKGVLFLQV